MLKGHLCTFGAAVLFGLMSPMCKLAMQGGELDALTLAFCRVSGAAVFFWLISPFCPRQPIRKKDWLPLLGMSLCGMIFNQFFYVLGIQYTSPSNACIVGTFTPVMTFILAAVFLHHRITAGRIVGLGVACTGALVLVLGSGSNRICGHPFGDMLCLFSQFSAACYFVFFGGILKLYHPVTIMKWLFLMASGLTLLPMWSHLSELQIQHICMMELLAVLYIVVGGSFFSYLLLIVGQKCLEPPTVAAYNYIQPLLAVAVGVFLGLDSFSWLKALSLILIACGVTLISVLSSEKASKSLLHTQNERDKTPS